MVKQQSPGSVIPGFVALIYFRNQLMVLVPLGVLLLRQLFP